MSWLARWFSSPGHKRSLDEDVSQPEGKKARVLFKEPVATNEFAEDAVLTFSPNKDSGLLAAVTTSSLVPRPLTVVAALDKSGELSLVATDSCTLVSEFPPYVCVGISKDAYPEDASITPVGTISATKEFTISIVSEWLGGAAYASTGGYALPSNTTEADLNTGLTTSKSEKVAVPRISEAAVSLECKVHHKHQIKNSQGEVATTVFIAEVLCAVVKEGVLGEDSEGNKVVNAKKLRPVAALGNATTARVSDPHTAALSAPFAPKTPSAAATAAVAAAPIDEPQAEVVEAVAAAVASALDSEGTGAPIVAVDVTLATEDAQLDRDIPVTVTQEV